MKRKTKFKNSILLIMGSLFITALNAQEYRKAEEAEGLTIGSPAPLFEASDAENKTFKLENALKEGPVVLIFYRGFWCPVCNKHLSGIQDSLKLIQEMGARVVAVSPKNPNILIKWPINQAPALTCYMMKDTGYQMLMM
ncbi:MAG: redoxin domain-containing protein [Bacteroidota bacterium]|nr:redoxin domain-containing protein [Bacteroidota bacterium]